ncbi:MAG TPA: zinc ABC transporter substrate-binding protein [Deltaproteobacteria bacterium]|nr:MAG: hypothetical protein A2048_11010 [Deltaproteobacteria bacterium GWA2_45_12]HBF13503.1 zinc ABC transporter substrate-binding protein [Deltaproteobacteria bacterium]
MKKFISFFLFAFFISHLAHAKLKVVTTTSDLASIASLVGGDLIEVKSLGKGTQDPHFLDAKPSYTVLVSQADLLIAVGLELEIGWMPVLQTQSRNPKVQINQRGYLEAWQEIPFLEIPSGRVDRSMGDVHSIGNPHYWLNPQNGLIMAKNIADRLKELDPQNAEIYQKNLNAFQTELQSRISAWQSQLKGMRGQKIITYHKTFNYFAEWAGLDVAGHIEPKPGIPPNAKHILEVQDQIRREHILLVITEAFNDPKPGLELSKKTGAKNIMLPTAVGGEPEIKTYFDLFDVIVKKIINII